MSNSFDGSLSVIWGINLNSYTATWDQGLRKAFVGELLVVFLIFVFQSIKSPMEQEAEVKSESAPPQGADQVPPQPQKVEAPAVNVTKELFNVLINHSIAIGLACWQPHAFTVAVAWLHLVFYVLIFVGRLKDKPVFVKIGHLGTVLMNILLLIAGTTGV